MEGREAMSFPGAHHHPPPPFYLPRGAFTSISPSQSANALHAPPSLRPMLNPNLQHPFPFGEQRHHQQEFVGHEIHMGMASSSSSPTMQSPSMIPQPPPMLAATEPVVKKKRGRPRKYVPESDNQIALGLSPMDSSHKAKNSSSSMSDPNAPKRARGRPPGTGRKQRLANLRTGTVSSVTLRQPASSVPSLSFQGPFEILSIGGSYLVNEEGGPKNRSGGISVSLSRPDGYLLGGGVGTLIAASLVQVVACSFVYGSAKAKAIKQENGSKEHKSNNMETTTPTREPMVRIWWWEEIN
ncbi:unnamed protein product [Arabis nemorensis]|uniref:AT-hook motif nuclear-localized protein n=1 Tax=Arabis nemorensis TaxID=586526 RepID=A0A565C7A4_9BRAS|nr:unnamed protein product [Arabis nemorensis]